MATSHIEVGNIFLLKKDFMTDRGNISTMSSTNVLLLPRDILLSVLRDWLGSSHKAISSLDVAMACSIIRPAYLDIISDPLLVLQGEDRITIVSVYAQWLNQRRVKVDSLHVRQQGAEVFFGQINDLLLRSVKLIDTCTSDAIDSTALRSLVGLCQNVVELDLGTGYGSDSFLTDEHLEGLATLPEQVAIKTLMLPLHSQITHKGICAILYRFRNSLEALRLCIGKSPFDALVVIASACRQLKKFMVYWDGTFLYSTSLVSFLTRFKMLEYLEVSIDNDDVDRFNDEEIVEIARSNPHLAAFIFATASFASPLTMDSILSCCPQMRYLCGRRFLYARKRSSASCNLECHPVHDSVIPRDWLGKVLPYCSDPVHCLSNSCQHDAADLAYIASQVGANLQQLEVMLSDSITDHDIINLVAHCPNLHTLRFLRQCVGLTDASIAGIAAHCPHLHTFTLTNCEHITDSGIELITQQYKDQLVSLDVRGCSQLSAGMLKHLAQCSKLQELNIACVHVHAADIFDAILDGAFRSVKLLSVHPQETEALARQVSNLGAAGEAWKKVLKLN